MRRALFVLAGLGIFSLAAIVGIPSGRAQPPANLFNQPWNQSGTAPTQPVGKSTVPTSLPPFPTRQAAGAPQTGPDSCADLVVTPQVGPWMITIISYSTRWNKPETAAEMAREMCLYLRNQYKLPAYVYVHGAKEMQEEADRVQKIKDGYNEMWRKATDTTGNPVSMPGIRVSRVRIDLEYAVLIGGYKDMDTAKQERDRLRRLPAPDPKKVKLAGMVVGEVDSKKVNATTAANPFITAMVGRNPTIPAEKQAKMELDSAELKRLNADEEFSLLKNNKPYTLLVKQYQLATVVESNRTTSGSFLSKIGLGERVDSAAESAHNLAIVLRKGKWDAYVLHTRFYSLVTVSGYDKNDYQRMVRDQQALAELNKRLDPLMQLMPEAKPIEVPK